MFYSFMCYFIIFAFLGWCTEVAFAAYKHGKFVNRGFLDGPVCPIYGFGVAFIYLIVSFLPQKDWIIVAASFLLPTLLELVTGFVMEKIFNHKWWDYSGERWNLGGYICLKFSIIWGLACVALVKIIFPLTDKLISVLPYNIFYIVAWALCIFVMLDTVGSVFAIIGINKKLRILDSIDEKLHEGSDKIGKKVYEGTVDIIELKNKVLSKTNFFHKHIIKAFPNMKSKKYKSLEEFKEYVSSKKKK